jgi:ABC-type transport system involved in multi-copper enzyme maturation permease subunit
MSDLLTKFLDFLGPHASLYIGLAVMLCGLIYGIGDVSRFAFRRIWAISGVCFAESIRRRVLWIIPLAIVGLVIVVQLQQPLDEQDAIRETTKFCLFAAGLVVVTSTIILACTNLPREIENRVIFTVVTKPTTRLEIVLGKIVGFARVSFTILLIMGIFTFGYLHFRAWSLERDLRERLSLNAVEAISRPTFQHYVDAGLLNAKTLANPTDMNIFGQAPVPGSNRRYPQPEGYMLVPFKLPADMWAVVDTDNSQHPGPGMVIQARAGYDPAPAKAGKSSAVPPKISISIFDPNANSALSADIVKMPSGVIPSTDGSLPLFATIPPAYVATLTKFPFIYVALDFNPGDNKIWFNVDPANPPVQLQIPVTTSPDPIRVNPSGPAVFTGREGVSGQQVKGNSSGQGQACVYRYRDLPITPRAGATVPIEFRVGVEKGGETNEQDIPTDASMEIVNLDDQSRFGPIVIHPENNRPCYSSVPAAAVEGGNFDIIVHCLSDGQWINVRPRSLNVVQAQSSFALNLTKSLTVLWLLSILVTTISVFCSTFLSWPIAVMLTLVILLGRWGVDELGDAATAGIGRQFVTDFGVRDPAISHAMSDTVEQLNKALKTISVMLPDISQFSATDDIERGISIPAHTLTSALEVLVGFGLPLTVLAYVFLKNKEVAP